VIDNTISGGRVLRFEYDVPTIYPFIDEHGLSPLPPYIKRKPTPKDKEMYQTVYATERGSVAAPTAGLHFSKELLEDIKSRGIKTAFITLHIGLGTFRPIMVEDLTRHQMDSEYYHVPEKTANIINLAKSKKQKVIAVGTSTVRTLETITVAGFEINKTEGWTDNFIYPPYKFKMVNKLITNFHQPKSTLMMMVAAMTKKDFLLEAYQEAIDKKYRFYSYGDAMMVI
jgi:S-adenosylmethionine:tRNA ribosyltransferase-isomerase